MFKAQGCHQAPDLRQGRPRIASKKYGKKLCIYVARFQGTIAAWKIDLRGFFLSHSSQMTFQLMEINAARLAMPDGHVGTGLLLP
jgi:hypothetical protein